MTGDHVIIIGAGPVGLFSALRLGQKGIDVTVFEAEEGISRSPRAILQPPTASLEFSRAGILEEIIDFGHKVTTGAAWRDGSDTSKILAEFNLPPPLTPAACAVIISQDNMTKIFEKNALATGKVNIVFNHAFVRAEQHDDSVTVHVKRALDDAELQFTCSYLVGADGGRSAVRKSLGLSLEGFTWPDLRLVAVNIIYDLEKYGWMAGNFVVHPEDWAVVAKRGKGNQWRVATGVPYVEGGDDQALSDKTVMPVIKERLARILPGNTEEVLYLQAAPYTIHQRCVHRYRVGRVLLAGDAAHLNNPVGGLGLTTGILDAAHLANALEQVLIHDRPETVLDEYSRLRRETWKMFTNILSTENLQRLKSTDPQVVAERERYFSRINDPADIEFKAQEISRELAISTTFEPSDLQAGPK